MREVEAERDQAKQNLARAKTDEQYQAVAAVFDQLCKRAKSLEAEITAAEGQLTTTTDADSAGDMAMEIIRRLTELARDGEDLGAARQIFDLLNARLFLGFHPVNVKKRTLNKINRGGDLRRRRAADRYLQGAHGPKTNQRPDGIGNRRVR